MRAEPFAEMEAVAQLYLGSAASETIWAADDPARAFALAWTEREAKLKCQRQGLSEWREGPAVPGVRIRGRHIHDHGETVVTVVTAMGARDARAPGHFPSRHRVDLDEGVAGTVVSFGDQGGVAAGVQRE